MMTKRRRRLEHDFAWGEIAAFEMIMLPHQPRSRQMGVWSWREEEQSDRCRGQLDANGGERMRTLSRTAGNASCVRKRLILETIVITYVCKLNNRKLDV